MTMPFFCFKLDLLIRMAKGNGRVGGERRWGDDEGRGKGDGI